MKLLIQIILIFVAAVAGSLIRAGEDKQTGVSSSQSTSSSSRSEVEQSLGSSLENPRKGYKVARLEVIEKGTVVETLEEDKVKTVQSVLVNGASLALKSLKFIVSLIAICMALNLVLPTILRPIFDLIIIFLAHY